jgi:hypothetical protein
VVRRIIVVGGMSGAFPSTITLTLEHLFGSHNAHWIGIIESERQTFGIPELNLVGLVILLLREGRVGRAVGE